MGCLVRNINEFCLFLSMNLKLIFWVFWLIIVLVVSLSLYMYINKAASDKSGDLIKYCNDIALALDATLLEKGNVTLIYDFVVPGYSVKLEEGENGGGVVVLEYSSGKDEKNLVEKCFYVRNKFCKFILENYESLVKIIKVCEVINEDEPMKLR